MKEIIEIAVCVAMLTGGTVLAKKIHDEVQTAALTKASKGLPSLSQMTKKLTDPISKTGYGDNKNHGDK